MLTADELAGYNLFRGKANCNSCHLDAVHCAIATAPHSEDTGAAADTRPGSLLRSANLGLPLNPRDAFYYQTTPDFFASPRIPTASGTGIWDWELSSEAVSALGQPE